MLDAGSTFQAANPTRRAPDDHLWVVVSDPAQNPDKVLIANLTSWSKDGDQSCVLESDEHPFLKHKSCVNYRQSNIISAERIQSALAAGVLLPRDNVSAGVLKKIRHGASVSAVSKSIPLDNLQLLRDQNLVQ